MGAASEDVNSGHGCPLTATAAAIIAARQEESIQRWDPSRLLSRLCSQSCSAPHPISLPLELIVALGTPSGADIAASASVQVQACESYRVGQGVGVDEAARGAGSPEVVGEELVSNDDRNMGGRSINDFYAFDRGEQPVGWGGYNTVFKGTSRSTGQTVAVKMVSREHSSRPEVTWVTDQECGNLISCFDYHH